CRKNGFDGVDAHENLRLEFRLRRLRACARARGFDHHAGRFVMKKIVRNMSTAESREFWDGIERSSIEVRQWPAWERAGINVSQFRREPRVVPPEVRTSKESDGTK